MLQADQLKQRIDKIEECTDAAKRAVQTGSAPAELRQIVGNLHEQAHQAQQAATDSQQMGQDGMRNTVVQMEQTGDRAMQVCRSSGNSVDQKTQQAVQRAHDEISSLKKQMQMG